MLNLHFTPRAVCWVHKRGASLPLLAVSDHVEPWISVYDGRGENVEPLTVLKTLHRNSVSLMAYNDPYDCVVSADEVGMLEYWRPSGTYEKPENVFQYKSSTSLFDFKKVCIGFTASHSCPGEGRPTDHIQSKSVPVSINFSPDGSHFAIYSSPDRKIRVFDFRTGKLHRIYDESLETVSEMQQAGTALQTLDEVDFGRRLATERELDNPQAGQRMNVIFDESGHFILYGSMLGIKVINTVTNRVVRVYGQDENIRALNLCLYQGQPEKKGLVTVSMAASANPLLQEAEARDPMLVCTAVGKVRFYLFTNSVEYVPSSFICSVGFRI